MIAWMCDYFIVWEVTIIYVEPRDCSNIRYPSETHLKLNSPEISFVQQINLISLFVLKIWTKRLIDTAVRWAKFKNDLTCEQ